jgi:hypothetical protein
MPEVCSLDRSYGVPIGAHVVGFFPPAWAEHLSLALPVPYLCNKTLKILDTHLFHTLGL